MHHHHDHDHDHDDGRLGTAIRHWFRPHSHDASDSIDTALEGSAEGIRVVKLSLLGLGLTALLQLVVVSLSGSVALLADTIHNFADASTALPLWLAFSIGRRAPNRRFPYGYHRGEDPRLPPPELQYDEHARHERARLTDAVYAELLA